MKGMVKAEVKSMYHNERRTEIKGENKLSTELSVSNEQRIGQFHTENFKSNVVHVKILI